MDQTVCITVVGSVWMALHVTELPESVTLAALLGTPEYCVTQVWYNQMETYKNMSDNGIKLYTQFYIHAKDEL